MSATRSSPSAGRAPTQITVYLSNSGNYEWTLGMNIIVSSNNSYLTYLCPMPDVSNIFRDDQWHMVTLTRNNNDMGTLYLDGSPIMINLGGGQGRVQSLCMSNTVTNLQNGSNDLRIGTDGSSYFKGSLDDIRVYDRALSASEIEALASPTEVSVQGTASAAEPSTPGTFTVSRVGVLGSNLTVLYTVSGTAVAGTNYVALPGSVVIPAGQSSATITVTPINDYSLDFTQTIVVTLQSANDYELGSSPSASIDLLDDNVPTVTLAMTQNYASETDLGAGLFTLTRSGTGPALTANALSVYYTIGGTAVSGVDYAALSGVATIPAGQTSATIPVTPLGDTMSVSDATVSLALSSGAYTNGSATSGTVVIFNQALPTVSITASSPNASEVGPVDGAFTVTRSGSTAGALTVYYTISGTAVAGTDYTALPGSVTIPAGQTSASFTVAPIDNDLLEGPQTVTATLVPFGVRYDLDGDGVIDQSDVDDLVRNILHTNYGDANLDHYTDFGDFQTLLYDWMGHYGWAGGDFNGDGVSTLATSRSCWITGTPLAGAAARRWACRATSTATGWSTPRTSTHSTRISPPRCRRTTTG